jgi:hypothetical protein
MFRYLLLVLITLTGHSNYAQAQTWELVGISGTDGLWVDTQSLKIDTSEGMREGQKKMWVMLIRQRQLKLAPSDARVIKFLYRFDCTNDTVKLKAGLSYNSKRALLPKLRTDNVDEHIVPGTVISLFHEMACNDKEREDTIEFYKFKPR